MEQAPYDNVGQTGWWPFWGGGSGEAQEAVGSGRFLQCCRERMRGKPVPRDPITTFRREAPGSTEMCISDSGNQWREKEVFLNLSDGKINAQERQTVKDMEFGSEGLDSLLVPQLGPGDISGPQCSHPQNRNIAPIHIRELV